MVVEKIISEAIANDVYLYVEGGKLKYKAKAQGLPQQLKQLIQQHKEQVIDYLVGELNRAQHQIQLHDRSKPQLLSFAQQRMWFMNQYTGPSALYNMFLALKMSAQVNIQVLNQALCVLFERHESLRTHFQSQDGQPIQVIGPALVDLAVETYDNDAQLKAIHDEEKNYPFDLSCDPLCRLRLVKGNQSGEYGLFITMHHSISDGWSLGIFFNELN